MQSINPDQLQPMSARRPISARNRPRSARRPVSARQIGDTITPDKNWGNRYTNNDRHHVEQTRRRLLRKQEDERRQLVYQSEGRDRVAYLTKVLNKEKRRLHVKSLKRSKQVEDKKRKDFKEQLKKERLLAQEEQRQQQKEQERQQTALTRKKEQDIAKDRENKARTKLKKQIADREESFRQHTRDALAQQDRKKKQNAQAQARLGKQNQLKRQEEMRVKHTLNLLEYNVFNGHYDVASIECNGADIAALTDRLSVTSGIGQVGWDSYEMKPCPLGQKPVPAPATPIKKPLRMMNKKKGNKKIKLQKLKR